MRGAHPLLAPRCVPPAAYHLLLTTCPLLLLARRAVHPEDFDFNDPDEAEESFVAYRRELSTLFKGIARAHAALAQEFVRGTLQQTLEAIESVPWTHLEVALWLLYTLGEGLPEPVLRDKVLTGEASNTPRHSFP